MNSDRYITAVAWLSVNDPQVPNEKALHYVLLADVFGVPVDQVVRDVKRVREAFITSNEV